MTFVLIRKKIGLPRIFLINEEGQSSLGTYQVHVNVPAIAVCFMSVVTSDSAIVLSHVSVYDCIAPGIRYPRA